MSNYQPIIIGDFNIHFNHTAGYKQVVKEGDFSPHIDYIITNGYQLEE